MKVEAPEKKKKYPGVAVVLFGLAAVAGLGAVAYPALRPAALVLDKSAQYVDSLQTSPPDFSARPRRLLPCGARDAGVAGRGDTMWLLSNEVCQCMDAGVWVDARNGDPTECAGK